MRNTVRLMQFGYLVLTYFVAAFSGAAMAQSLSGSTDLEQPVVVHRPSDLPGVGGELQTFVARASDDIGVQSVTLYYRNAGTSQFEAINMRLLYDSIDEYMIAIDTELANPVIEYFIVARDASGKVGSRGDQDKPLTLSMRAGTATAAADARQAAVATPPQPPSRPQAAQRRPATGAILLAVGAVILLGAAAAGGGSNNGSGNPPNTVQLTIFGPDPSAN